MKLDYAKPYDTLDWNFILEVLNARGFGCRWINWIICLVVGGKSQIGLRGNLKKSIQTAKPNRIDRFG